MGLLRNQSQRLKALPSFKIKRFFKSFRGEPLVGCDNNPIRSDKDLSFPDDPSFLDFDFANEPRHIAALQIETENQCATTSHRTLQFEADNVLNRQISPHRSPPNQPYASGSSFSDDEGEPQTSRSNSNSSVEYDIPPISHLRPPRRESVIMIPEKSPFRLVPEVSPVIEQVEMADSDSSSVYSSDSVQQRANSGLQTELQPVAQAAIVRNMLSMNPYAVPTAVRSKLPPRLSIRQSLMRSEFSFISSKRQSFQKQEWLQQEQQQCSQSLYSKKSPHQNQHQQQSRAKSKRQSIAKSSKMDSRRVSIASSMASMLPYILKFNNEDMEYSGTKLNQSQTSLGDILLQEDSNVQKLSTSQQIERIIAQQSTAGSIQPLRVRKKAAEDPLHPCKIGVADYASSLDREFEQYQGIEPDSEFRERILRGGGAHSIRRRTRFLDKDLPALPGWGAAPEISLGKEPSRLNTLCRKFRLT